MIFIRLIENPSEYYKGKGIQDEAIMGFAGSVMQELWKCFPNLGNANIRALWNDLYNQTSFSLDL
jgi:hypothetical protein